MTVNCIGRGGRTTTFVRYMPTINCDKEIVFTGLYHSTHHLLYHYIRKFTRDSHLIEDLMQQAYLKVWERQDRIINIEEALPLLKTYTRNLLIDVIRRRMKEGTQWLESLQKEVEQIVESHSFRESNKQLQMLDIAIARLPDNCRKVYLFHREDGMSHKEIASKLSISVSMVEKYMSRAIRLLKQDLLTDYSMILLVIAAGEELLRPPFIFGHI